MDCYFLITILFFFFLFLYVLPLNDWNWSYLARASSLHFKVGLFFVYLKSCWSPDAWGGWSTDSWLIHDHHFSSRGSTSRTALNRLTEILWELSPRGGWSTDSWLIIDHQFFLEGKYFTYSPQPPYWDIMWTFTQLGQLWRTEQIMPAPLWSPIQLLTLDLMGKSPSILNCNFPRTGEIPECLEPPDC